MAEAAILRVNPHLKKASGFKSGATVIIPGDIKLKPKDQPEQTDPSLSGVLKNAEDRLQLSMTEIEVAYAKSNAEIKTSVSVLKNRRFRQTAAKQSKNGAKLITSALKNQTQEQEINKKREQEFIQIIKDNMDEIEKLRKLVKN
ncbi:MAG: hypothetical protein V7750_16520 [Sneathiella sp.]